MWRIKWFLQDQLDQYFITYSALTAMQKMTKILVIAKFLHSS